LGVERKKLGERETVKERVSERLRKRERERKKKENTRQRPVDGKREVGVEREHTRDGKEKKTAGTLMHTSLDRDPAGKRPIWF